MKTNILDIESKLLYKIDDYTNDQVEMIEKSFFTKNGASYEKSYNKNTFMIEHDTDMVRCNFAKYFPMEIDKKYTQDNLINALIWLHDTHNKHNIQWWVVGSAALFLRGIDIIPHDIDVMSTLESANEILDVVKPYIVEPFHFVNDWFVKGFGVIDYNYRLDYSFDAEDWVDQDGALDFGPTAAKDLDVIFWQDRKYLVPKIQYHLRSNTIRKRDDVVKKIHSYIEHNA